MSTATVAGSQQLRIELYERARSLVSSHEPKDQRELVTVLESLYRRAQQPGQMVALQTWIETYASDVPAAEPWLALVRLARTKDAQAFLAPLRAVDQALAQAGGRTALVLQTEAARHLRRISGNPYSSWARMGDSTVPDPHFGDAALEAISLRLQLAAEVGNWNVHDRLASNVLRTWSEAGEALPPALMVILAEHEVRRGRYAAALASLAPLATSIQPDIQLATLQIRLEALLACADAERPAELEREIEDVAAKLQPLLVRTWEPSGWLPVEERRKRLRQAGLLLQHALRRPPEPVHPGSESERPPGLAQLLALSREDPGRALQLCNLTLASGSCRQAPEIELRLRLLRVQLTLKLRGAAMAPTCEGWVNMVLAESQALDLPVLEMLAYDQRAILRGRYFAHRWREVVHDAAQAAHRATHLVWMNRNSVLERALRNSLMPVFDRVVQLLVEGAQRTASREPHNTAQIERLGKVVLDYVEQAMGLSLAEARHSNGLGSGEIVPGLSMNSEPEEGPNRVADLQAALSPRDAVLQYFMLDRYLLVFVYGLHFFHWQARQLPLEGVRQPKAARLYLDRLLTALHGDRGRRHESLEELRRWLLPESITRVLVRESVDFIAIVPHDVLGAAPFSQLRWSPRHRFGTRFQLSLHSTGTEAVRRRTQPWQPPARPRLLLLCGPRGDACLEAEAAQVAAALGTAVTVEPVDGVELSPEGLKDAIADCDVLFLSCRRSAEARALALGSGGPDFTTTDLLDLTLTRCGLVVLPECWSGWLENRREEPVHGFPQVLRDVGVHAVVAPIHPLPDALRPAFAAIFCRTLCFLPAGAALGRTASLLRRRRVVARLVGAALPQDAFDRCEMRLTGNVGVTLVPSLWGRLIHRLAFYAWLLRPRLNRP